MTKVVELADFKFKDNFTDLTSMQLSQALSIINAQFSGVYSLWSFLSPDEARAKRELCINYLLAWKLMDMYPDSVVNASGMGSMPLSSKKAGPIFIKYRDTVRQSGSGLLESLTTNSYGMQALAMIQSAPEMFMVYA